MKKAEPSGRSVADIKKEELSCGAFPSAEEEVYGEERLTAHIHDSSGAPVPVFSSGGKSHSSMITDQPEDEKAVVSSPSGTPNENSIKQKVFKSIALGSMGLLAGGVTVYLIFTTTSVWIFIALLGTALLGASGLKKALSAKMDIDQLSKRSQLKQLNKISGFAMTLNIIVLSIAGLFAFLYLLNLIF